MAGAANVNDRVYVTFGGLPPRKRSGAGLSFVQNYEAQYAVEPDVYGIYGYEAAKVVLDAIRRAGKKERVAILRSCLATRDFAGALDKWSFDSNGDITNAQMSGNIIRNGEFVFLKRSSLEQ